MAVLSEVGVFTKDGSGVANATNVITLNNSSLTPNLIIMWTNGATGTGGANADACAAFGISDGGSNEISGGCVSEDGVGTSNSERQMQENALVIEFISSAAAVGTISATGAGTFTVQWTTNPSGTGVEVCYLVIQDDGITNVAAGNLSHSTSTTVDATISFTPLAFEPDFLVFIECDSNAVPAGGNGAALSIGMVDSSGSQFALAISDHDAQATTVAKRMQQATLCNINISFSGVTIRENEFSAFTASGWDWIQRKADASGRKFLYFAIKGASLEVFNGTTRTSAGTKSYTVGIAPSAALIMGVNNTVATGLQADSRLTIGAMDGSRENSMLAVSDDNVATSECGISHVTTGVHETTTGAVAAAGPTIDGLAEYSSFGALSFSLQWSDPDSAARQIVGLVVGGGTGGGKPSQIIGSNMLG